MDRINTRTTSGDVVAGALLGTAIGRFLVKRHGDEKALASCPRPSSRSSRSATASPPASECNRRSRAAGRTCAFGAPAIGSAGCGLDRSPGPVLALRSRGVSLLPPSGRETTHAASYWTMVGQQVLSSAFDSGHQSFSEASVITLAARVVS